MLKEGKKYKHFKGNEYLLLHLAKHSETQEDLVVYQALYGERGIWVRPLSMFIEQVEVDGKLVNRFEEIQWVFNKNPSNILDAWIFIEKYYIYLFNFPWSFLPIKTAEAAFNASPGINTNIPIFKMLIIAKLFVSIMFKM